MSRYDTLLSTGVMAAGIATFVAVFGLRGGFDQSDRGTPAPVHTETRTPVPQKSPRRAPEALAPAPETPAPRRVSEFEGEDAGLGQIPVRPTRTPQATAAPTTGSEPAPETDQPEPEPSASSPAPVPTEVPDPGPEQNPEPMVEQISDQ